MNIGIIGGGVAGLAAAYDLGRQGHRVTLCEAGPRLGGLAGSFDFGGVEIEKFYHFICKPDVDLLAIADELGLGDQVVWRHSPMGYFVDGHEYPFGTPLELLRFTPVSFIDRIRLGLAVFRARFVKRWEDLEGLTGKEWLVQLVGEHAYRVVWDPLLRVKFGPYFDQVSAAWMWHRIHRVAQSRDGLMAKERMGFFTGGSQMLVDRLTEELERANVDVRLQTPVDQIALRDGRAVGLRVNGEVLECDAVISTAALPLLARLLPDEAATYRDEVARVQFLNVVCMILKLRHPMSRNFWLNVNDSRIAFNGIIEYTNLNPRPDLGDTHIAYIPFYLRPDAPRFRMSDEALFEEYCTALAKVNPDFDPTWVIDYRVFRAQNAQAVCGTHFSAQVPKYRAPVEGLYVCDSTQLYPSDRTISGMIGIGRHVAGLVMADG